MFENDKLQSIIDGALSILLYNKNFHEFFILMRTIRRRYIYMYIYIRCY